MDDNSNLRVRCQSVCLSFGGVRILHDVNVDFPNEGITAIIGPNGAGKTTLFNVISGLTKVDSGRCFAGRFDISDWKPHEIARLGIARTFQQLRLVRQMSALDNVVLHRPNQVGENFFCSFLPFTWRSQEAANRNFCMDLLSYVGLEDSVFHQIAGDLSYGQQKLLSMACSLASDASILLWDEPLSGVHPEIRSRIIELMSDLKRKGKLLIFIEHDIESVKKIADQIYLMVSGEFVLSGPVDEVLEHPATINAYLG